MSIRTIGITGGIGSGKTMIAWLIRHLGYPVYIADREASRLMNRDECLRREMKARFGPDIYTTGGPLNKPLLAQIIFQDQEALQAVNHIVHPRVMEDFRCWSQCQGQSLVFFESAILFEARLDHYFDFIICVTAPASLRLNRVVKRDRTTTEAVKKRMSNQMDNREKCKRSDFIIHNDERHPVIVQITDIIQQIKTI